MSSFQLNTILLTYIYKSNIFIFLYINGVYISVGSFFLEQG